MAQEYTIPAEHFSIVERLPQTLPRLSSGQALSGIAFTAPGGVMLQIQVDDSAALLSPPAAIPALIDPALELILKRSDSLTHHIPLPQ